MSLKRIEQTLEQTIGLSTETIGPELVRKVVLNRMGACHLSDVDEYFAYLETANDEWDELVEALVIPETWFFRNQQSFLFLRHYVQTEWLPNHPTTHVLRILSFPCSTGEEPYSIVMTLLDAGFPARRISLDALDVSQKALQKASDGVYGRESFRGADVFPWRDRYFRQIDDMYSLQDSVKNLVHFTQGNLLDHNVQSNGETYDVVFCRNVLIYLSKEAKQHVVTTLDLLLETGGILFVGHAERSVFQTMGYEWIQQPAVFACRKVRKPDVESSDSQSCSAPDSNQKADIPTPLLEQLPFRRVFERRKTERIVPLQPENAGNDKTSRNGARDIDPEHRPLHDEQDDLLDAALRLADQGQLTQALTLSDEVLSQTPAHVEANFLKGLIYQALRDEQQAEASFSRTVYLDPNHYDALSHLALIAEHQGDHEKARLLRQRMARLTL